MGAPRSIVYRAYAVIAYELDFAICDIKKCDIKKCGSKGLFQKVLAGRGAILASLAAGAYL
jgi:hypothetical protein